MGKMMTDDESTTCLVVKRLEDYDNDDFLFVDECDACGEDVAVVENESGVPASAILCVACYENAVEDGKVDEVHKRDDGNGS